MPQLLTSLTVAFASGTQGLKLLEEECLLLGDLLACPATWLKFSRVSFHAGSCPNHHYPLIIDDNNKVEMILKKQFNQATMANARQSATSALSSIDSQQSYLPPLSPLSPGILLLMQSVA